MDRVVCVSEKSSSWAAALQAPPRDIARDSVARKLTAEAAGGEPPLPRWPCPKGQRDRLGEYSPSNPSLPTDPRGLLMDGTCPGLASSA